MKKFPIALALVIALVFAGFACKKAPEPTPTEPAQIEQPADPQPVAETPAAPPAAEQPAAGTLASKSYRYVLEASGPNQPKMRFEYLVVPPKMNVKMMNDQDGQLVTSVHLVTDGVDYWLVQPEAKMAMKMPPEAKPEIPTEFIFAPDWAEFQRAKTEGFGIEDQGKVDVNGQPMTKYLVKNPAGQEQMTVYVDGGNMVRRIEVPQEGQNVPFIMDVIELEMNPTTSDADFRPPAGFTVHEMPSMPGMGGAPQTP